MKTKKIILAVVLAVGMILMLSACSQLGNLLSNPSESSGTTTTQDSGTKLTSVQVVIHNQEGYSATDFVDNTTMKTKVPATDPTKVGYIFKGWYTNEECTNALKAGVKLTENVLHIYVKWEGATYDVKFVDSKNGEVVITYAYGDKINISDPMSSGFIFSGWFTDSACTKAYDVNAAITSELILYAKWSYVQYTITFNLNDGRFPTGTTVPATYDEGTTVTLPEPIKNEYDFMGWYESETFTGDPVTELNGATGNKVFYAKFLSNEAEMSATAGVSTSSGDTLIAHSDYTAKQIDLRTLFAFSENCSITVEDITPIMAEDLSNYPNGIITYPTSVVQLFVNNGSDEMETRFQVHVVSESGKNEKTFSVKILQYNNSVVTVTYEVDGVQKLVENLSMGASLGTSTYEAPAKTGYSFDCWMKGLVKYDFTQAVTESITLTAKYTAIDYTITYSLGAAKNAVANPATYTIEDTVSFANPIVPDGYTFIGWFDDETYTNEVVGLTSSAENVTIYALYTKAEKWSFTYDNENDEYTIVMAQYPYFLDYLVYSRVDEATVVITDIPEDFRTYYLNPDFTGTQYTKAEADELWEQQKLKTYSKATTDGGEINVSYELKVSVSGNKVTLIFNEKKGGSWDYINPTTTSAYGTYDQVNFVEFQEKAGRANDFTDFAIDHVQVTLPASDSEQLFFALENGYRPVCEQGSNAETIYNAMRTILKNNVNDNMTDVEKVIAIAEYLVKEIEYDNHVYDLYMNGADTSVYKCFKLEGAILDGVAVCDGISKAFACLCRMEGIEAVQVDGTHNGTNHAWNKVKVDLDGDGVKDWSVVDCTSANLLLTLERNEQTNAIVKAVEIMNHSFILTSDDMLINKEGYVYADKWDGLYETETYYNIYQHVTLGEGEDTISLYVTTAEQLEAVFKYYIEEIYPNTVVGKRPISLSFCALSSLIDNSIGTVMCQAGFTADQINNGLVTTTGKLNAQQDGECIYLFYLNEEEAE